MDIKITPSKEDKERWEKKESIGLDKLNKDDFYKLIEKISEKLSDEQRWLFARYISEIGKAIVLGALDKGLKTGEKWKKRK